MAYPPEISEEAGKPIEVVSDIEDQKVTENLESDIEAIPDQDDLGLDLDLELASESKETAMDLETKVEAEETDELDLSDLKDLLDKEEEAESEGVTEEAVKDLDLDLEMTLEPDTKIKKTPESAELEELDELDLSDLEDILDLDEPMAEKATTSEDIELELDMETEPELEHLQEGVESENLEAFDLSELEKMLKVEEDTAIEAETEGKALEIELDMEEVSTDIELSEDSSNVEVFELNEAYETVDQSESVDIDEPEAEASKFVAEEGFQDDELEEGADEEPVLKQMAAAKKRRASKPIVVLFILALLAGGAYGTYVLLDFMNIEIPYVSDYFKPQVSDPSGNLKIETLDINSKFILNVKEGKLFVITGRVKNGYSDVRRYININGKLYSKGKNLAQKETVFCGNVLSDIELSNMELEAIKKRLSNRLGDNKSNMQVKPGAELPFMVVFSNLPEDLEEFSVEVVGSTSE
ncbi:MAG: DUF3426 domain-containing protein [Desulfobacterales bacterium]